MKLLQRLIFGFAALALAFLALAKAAPDAARPVHIALVGDSTVTDSAGWGAAFAKRLKPEVTCTNKARGGASTKSYRDGTKLWPEALALKPTHVFIQFGHNDMPGKGEARETDPATTFRDNLSRYIAEARAIGAQPIIVSSVTRRNFKDGKIVDLLAGYAAGAKAVAAKEKVPFIDLHARSIEAVTKLGPEGSAELGPMKDGKRDTTHFSPEGAAWAAELVIVELKRVMPETAVWFK
ncbi:MAG: rhamnogalacturonan acetylesterase [Verrucomicrobiota bacterium]